MKFENLLPSLDLALNLNPRTVQQIDPHDGAHMGNTHELRHHGTDGRAIHIEGVGEFGVWVADHPFLEAHFELAALPEEAQGLLVRSHDPGEAADLGRLGYILPDARIAASDPETGIPLWEHLWKIKTNPRCVQPLVVDGQHIVLGATGTAGSRLLRIQKKDASWDIKEEWTTKAFRPYFNDCVSHKGYIYGFDGDRFACIDLKTGERRWEGKRYSGQLLLFPDMDTILVLSEAGDVVLIQATPERFNEIARFKALTGKTWNHPVVAHGKLFVRNAEEAACFELPIANSPTIGGRDLELPTGVKSLAVSGHYAHLSLLPQSAWHRAI